ncbi:MAG: DUF1924 domain-containing protein [Rhodocyclaceae bacterium]|nr:DUF1924 domain-containing protein [Rhodocyclaceae bacterium]
MKISTLIAGLLLATSLPAGAAGPADFLQRFEGEARSADPGFAASPARGRDWFAAPHGQDWRCTSCHTADPGKSGRHKVTGKAIEPMAPAVNPERLTSERSVAKWFRRNCRDVVGRECTAAEKADVVAYLIQIGQ